MNDVDHRIRAAMRTLADQIPVGDASLKVLPSSTTVPTSRRRLRVVALSALAVAAAALVFMSTRETDQSVRTVDQNGEHCPPGDIYLIAGASNDNARLYSGSLCPLRLAPVSDVTRARGVSGSGDLIVVSFEAGGAAKLVAGKTEPLPGVEAGPTSDASVSADGLVAFTTSQSISGGAATDRLHVYDPKAGTSRPVLADNRFLSRPAWGPGGRIAVYRNAGRSGEVPEITIVEPDGTARHIAVRPPPSLGYVEHLLWGPSSPIAFSYNVGGLEPVTTLVDPGTGVQQVFRGWHALAWSPDGTTLLVEKKTGDRQLALAGGPKYDRLRKIGEAPAHVFAASWLACPTASRCTPAPDVRRSTGRIQLDFAEFERLVQEGQIQSADVYEKRSTVTGRYVADDGAEGAYTARIPSSTTTEELLYQLIEAGVAVVTHGR